MLGDSGDAYTLEAVAIAVGALFCTRIAVIPAACSASGGLLSTPKSLTAVPLLVARLSRADPVHSFAAEGANKPDRVRLLSSRKPWPYSGEGRRDVACRFRTPAAISG